MSLCIEENQIIHPVARCVDIAVVADHRGSFANGERCVYSVVGQGEYCMGLLAARGIAAAVTGSGEDAVGGTPGGRMWFWPSSPASWASA
jgi:hypothetical protein